jgi:hypothetical protein
LAEGQRGLFSSAQAVEIGASHDWLCRNEKAGKLRRVRHGVYAMRGAPASPWDPIVGAAIAAGPNAVVSHGSAAAVHRFDYASLAALELTVPRARNGRVSGVTVHRSSEQLDALDLIRKRGLLVTSQPRTLVDMAGRWGPVLTEKQLDEGVIAHRWTIREVQSSLARARPNLPGRPHLESLLAQRAEEPSADSLLEARIFRILEPLGPFKTHFCTVIGDRVYVIDIAWPWIKVGAEIAGRAHRLASRSAFDRERRKFNDLLAAGWLIGNITATMSNADALGAVEPLLRERSQR